MKSMNSMKSMKSKVEINMILISSFRSILEKQRKNNGKIMVEQCFSGWGAYLCHPYINIMVPYKTEKASRSCVESVLSKLF